MTRIKLGKLLAWSVTLACVTATTCTAANQPLSMPPTELVRQAVRNEMQANAQSGQRFRFKDEKRTPHTSQTKLIVETREGTAGMVVLQDGHPLNAEQQKAEDARLDNYVKNPDELNKKRKQEREDVERTERIVKALPDAFLYEADGTVPGSAGVGRAGDNLVRLKFRPNPNYDPPSHVEQVLTGMAGILLVDANEKRIAQIDGTLKEEVSFGWGIFGHLDKGGRFLVQQADVGNRHWEVSRMELSFTGKILIFKKLNIRSSDIFSEFKPVAPDLSFAQAVDLLKKESADLKQTAH